MIFIIVAFANMLEISIQKNRTYSHTFVYKQMHVKNFYHRKMENLNWPNWKILWRRVYYLFIFFTVNEVWIEFVSEIKQLELSV